MPTLILFVATASKNYPGFPVQILWWGRLVPPPSIPPYERGLILLWDRPQETIPPRLESETLLLELVKPTVKKEAKKQKMPAPVKLKCGFWDRNLIVEYIFQGNGLLVHFSTQIFITSRRLITLMNKIVQWAYISTQHKTWCKRSTEK